MQINKYHGSYNLSSRSGGVGAIKYICIHYTGGTGSAKNNCIYFSGGNRGASADYFVDDNGIWEYNDPSSGKYSWAVGDGHGKYGITNSNSISIEVVNNGGAFSAKEIAYLKELVPYLMKKFNVPSDRVVRHYDASRKSCPAYYVDGTRWASLKASLVGVSAPSGVTSSSTPATKPATKPAAKPSTSSSKISEDGWWGNGTTRRAQQVFGTVVDGIVSGQTSSMTNCNKGGLQSSSWKRGSGGSLLIKAIQKKVGVTADGYFGPNTCKAMQKWLGTPVDGVVSGPSTMVKKFQAWLNKQ